MVINFVNLKEIIRKKIIDIYDHTMINEMMDEVPTAENMVLIFWKKLENEFKSFDANLYEIKLYETDNSFVTIRKEQKIDKVFTNIKEER